VQPWVSRLKRISSPDRGDRKTTAKNSFAPSGAGLFGDVETHGFTVGYYLPRLRRWGMARATPEKTGVTATGAKHLTLLAF